MCNNWLTFNINKAEMSKIWEQIVILCLSGHLFPLETHYSPILDFYVLTKSFLVSVVDMNKPKEKHFQLTSNLYVNLFVCCM